MGWRAPVSSAPDAKSPVATGHGCPLYNRSFPPTRGDISGLVYGGRGGVPRRGRGGRGGGSPPPEDEAGPRSLWLAALLLLTTGPALGRMGVGCGGRGDRSAGRI